MVRATYSRLDKLDKPRLQFELRSASCRPPQRLQRHTPHSNWSNEFGDSRPSSEGTLSSKLGTALPPIRPLACSDRRSSSSEGCVSVVTGEVCKTRSSTRTLILVSRVLRMSPAPSRESPHYLAGEQIREIAARRSKEFRVEKSPATEYGGSLSRPPD